LRQRGPAVPVWEMLKGAKANPAARKMNAPTKTETFDGRKLLTEEERAKMLARIHSLVYWVGMLIPEHELLGGRDLDLRDIVFRLTTKDSLTEEEVAEARELIDLLKAKESSLERRLSHDPMTEGTAKEMLAEICGLLRAVDELREAQSPEHAEFRKQEIMRRVEDAKRWQTFLDTVRPDA